MMVRQVLAFLPLALAIPGSVFCQDSGVTFVGRYSASYENLGQVHRLDPAIGYRFGARFAITAGVPFYFVRSSAGLGTSGSTTANGIGNVYLNLRFAADNPAVDYWSVATVTAPTGDKSKGLSTGRVTIDWTNTFSREVGRVTPFVSLGVANAISDAPFWVRPFSSLGLNAHAEAGGLLRTWGPTSIGASGYAVLPAGSQTVYSRIVPRGNEMTSGGQGAGKSGASRKPVFETGSSTVGNSQIARDRGFSAWFSVSPGRYVNFILLYTHSTLYSLDSVSTGLGVNLGLLTKIGRL